MQRLKTLGALIVGIAAVVGLAIQLHEYSERRLNIAVAGWWSFEFRVTSTTYRPYNGLVYGYKVSITQDGKDVTGVGEKRWENGVEVPFTQHTQIELIGFSTRTDVRLSYKLKGAKRDTFGTITLSPSDDGALLVGSFSGTAANARGAVIARKIE